MKVAEWLRERGAVNDVCTWAERYGDDFERAFAECPRGDWLLGIAVKLGADPRAIVRAACACAREAEGVADDERSTRAIEAAERWARDGENDPSTRADAEAALDEAQDPAVAAARMAALAAARSVSEPADAALAAASAAQAIVLATGECAQLTAARYAMHKCAEHVRAHVTLARPV